MLKFGNMHVFILNNLSEDMMILPMGCSLLCIEINPSRIALMHFANGIGEKDRFDPK